MVKVTWKYKIRNTFIYKLKQPTSKQHEGTWFSVKPPIYDLCHKSNFEQTSECTTEESQLSTAPSWYLTRPLHEMCRRAVQLPMTRD